LDKGIEKVQNCDEVVHGKFEETVENFGVWSVSYQFGKLSTHHQLSIFTSCGSKDNKLEGLR
jgi:hypothetical protein